MSIAEIYVETATPVDIASAVKYKSTVTDDYFYTIMTNTYNTYDVHNNYNDQPQHNASYPYGHDSSYISNYPGYTYTSDYKYMTYTPCILECSLHSAATAISEVTKSAASCSLGISKYFLVGEDEVIENLWDVRNYINNADLTEKNDIAKYNFIESKFINTFGEDFMMARNLNLPSSFFYLIGVEFTDTINRLIDNPEKVNRERLFGNKSTDEILSSIRDSFPETLTKRDLFLMVNEKRSVGVLDSNSLRSIGEEGALQLIDTLGLIRSYAKFSIQHCDVNGWKRLSIEDRDLLWKKMLDQPVLMNDLLRLLNAWILRDDVIVCEETLDWVERFLGGVRGEDGLFIIDGGSSVASGNSVASIIGTGGNTNNDIDWDNILTQILGAKQEHEAFVRDRMKLICEFGNNQAANNVGNVPGNDYPPTDNNPGNGYDYDDPPLTDNPGNENGNGSSQDNPGNGNENDYPPASEPDNG